MAGVAEVTLGLSEGTEYLGVKSRRVCEVVRHDVHQHKQPPVGLLGHWQEVAERAVQRGEPRDVALLVTRQHARRRGRVTQFRTNPPQTVDVLPDVKIRLSNESMSSHALPGLRLIHVHDQVAVAVRHDEAQVPVVDGKLAGVDLERVGVAGNLRDGAIVLLILKHVDALADVPDQNEVFEGVYLVDVDLAVYEGYAVKIFVLELPDVDLLADRGDEESRDGRYSRDGSLLLLVIDNLHFVLGERLSRLRHYLYHIVDLDVSPAGEKEVFHAGDVFPVVELYPGARDRFPGDGGEELYRESFQKGVDEPVGPVLDRQLLVIAVELPDLVGRLGHGRDDSEGFRLEVKRDVMGRAPQRHLADGPGGVVGKVARQDADTKLGGSVEVEEPVGAVDVVEGGERRYRAVYRHRVGPQLSPARQKQPVRVRTGQEHALVAGNIVEQPQGRPQDSGSLVLLFYPDLTLAKDEPVLNFPEPYLELLCGECPGVVGVDVVHQDLLVRHLGQQHRPAGPVAQAHHQDLGHLGQVVQAPRGAVGAAAGGGPGAHVVGQHRGGLGEVERDKPQGKVPHAVELHVAILPDHDQPVGRRHRLKMSPPGLLGLLLVILLVPGQVAKASSDRDLAVAVQKLVLLVQGRGG